MFILALNFPLPNVEPEVKYFLVRFVQCFGITEPVSLGVKGLATRFGLSDRQVSESLAVLLAGGALAISSIFDGRGRPKRSYRLQDAFVAKFNKLPQEPSKSFDPLPFNEIHTEAIGRLLKHEKSKADQQGAKFEQRGTAAQMRARRQPGRLSVVNRLLLAVLLCHADRFGVVRDLGSSALRKTTGLNQERLKYRITRLINLGLIRAYVPGATSSVLFKKTSSVYFINLHHPELAIAGSVATSVFVYTSVMLADENDQQDAEIVQNKASYCLANPESASRILPRFKLVSRFFESQRPSIFRLFQVRLESYAAYLLSKYWPELVLRQSVKDEGLRVRIRDDFRSPKERPDPDSDSTAFPSKVHYEALVEEIYERAYGLAVRINTLFSGMSEISFESMDFTIISQVAGIGYYRFALLALQRSAEGPLGCFTLHQNAQGEMIRKTFSREADIPIGDQYRLGLRAKPSA
jgi:hypothetical protein